MQAPAVRGVGAIMEALYPRMAVSRPFPSWNRSILTDISLCHACSCQEILRAEPCGRPGGGHPPPHHGVFTSDLEAVAYEAILNGEEPPRSEVSPPPYFWTRTGVI